MREGKQKKVRKTEREEEGMWKEGEKRKETER